MQETFVYREAGLDDCKEVYARICEMECRQLPFARFSAIWKAQIDSRQYHCLVCACGNMVAGVINLRFEPQLHHAACIAEIMEFAVAPCYQRQGIGKEMLRRACVIAKDFGCTQIEVACNQLRADAHRFYLREGMRNFHFKFSKSLLENTPKENAIGR